MEVLEIARENDILVLEDNPYGLLYFDQAPPQAMRSVDEDGVIYLGTFSKTLAPGLRVGWAVAPHAIREKLILANEAAVLSPELVLADRHLASTCRPPTGRVRSTPSAASTASGAMPCSAPSPSSCRR